MFALEWREIDGAPQAGAPSPPPSCGGPLEVLQKEARGFRPTSLGVFWKQEACKWFSGSGGSAAKGGDEMWGRSCSAPIAGGGCLESQIEAGVRQPSGCFLSLGVCVCVRQRCLLLPCAPNHL